MSPFFRRPRPKRKTPIVTLPNRTIRTAPRRRGAAVFTYLPYKMFPGAVRFGAWFRAVPGSEALPGHPAISRRVNDLRGFAGHCGHVAGLSPVGQSLYGDLGNLRAITVPIAAVLQRVKRNR